MTTHQQTDNGEMRGRLERLIELLGAYFTTVLTGRLLEEVTAGELTPTQLEAMVYIHRHGGCSAKELSEGLRISIPSSTRLVDRLVRKGLVDRCECAEDRRLVQLTVTDTGMAMLTAVRDARIARLRQPLACLPEAEQAQLLGLLERYLGAACHDAQTVADCCLHCGTEHDGGCVVNEAHIALVGKPIERT